MEAERSKVLLSKLSGWRMSSLVPELRAPETRSRVLSAIPPTFWGVENLPDSQSTLVQFQPLLTISFLKTLAGYIPLVLSLNNQCWCHYLQVLLDLDLSTWVYVPLHWISPNPYLDDITCYLFTCVFTWSQLLSCELFWIWILFIVSPWCLEQWLKHSWWATQLELNTLVQVLCPYMKLIPLFSSWHFYISYSLTLKKGSSAPTHPDLWVTQKLSTGAFLEMFAF